MKYELTSQRITGSIILWFDDITGQLRKLEFDCELERVQMDYLSQLFPTHVDILETFKTQTKFACRILEEKVTFNTFWEEYGKKQNRLEAEAAWYKLKPIDQQRAVSYIKRYESILKLESYRSKMLASSYLGKRMWMDVIG